MSDVAKRIKELMHEGDELYFKLCRVIEINYEKRLADVEPIDGTAKILDVRLTASSNTEDADNDFICSFPKKGSVVAVGFFDSNEALVILASEIEKIELKLGTTHLLIDDKKCNLNADAMAFKLNKNSTLSISNDNVSLKDLLTRTLDEIMKIKVLQGVSPNIGALTKIKSDTNKLFK
jgi:hypothetical protein